MIARSLLNPAAAEHLAKLCGLFSSNFAAERASAAAKADQFVRKLGLTWSDVVRVPTPWQEMANVCRQQMHRLSDRERDFVFNVGRMRASPTDRQLAWLQSLYDKVGGGR